MFDKSIILEIVKKNGPVLPRDVVKEVGGDTFIIGAILSQLVDSKQIKLSNTKIGGSPVYYTMQQKDKLQLLYKYLHEKEKWAYDILKEEKVLKDANLDPVIRVSLRNIRDFAKGIEVNISGNREIFWKWYLYPNDKAEILIKNFLKIRPQTTQSLVENTKQPQIESQKQIIAEVIKQPQSESQPKLEPKSDIKHELHDTVKNLFRSKNVEIIYTDIIRKNTEIDMEIKIPSPVGNLNYFCKIKSKKKNTDKDLSSAFVQGNMKKLPVLYITSGVLTKKAIEMLETEFKMITVLQI